MKTLALVRISSSTDQDIASQKGAILDYCAKHGIVIDRWLGEEGSTHGNSLERPDLDDVMNAAEAGECQRLIVTSGDRIGRRGPATMLWMEELHALGVEIVSLADGGVIDLESENGELLAGIKALLARAERRAIARRTRGAFVVGPDGKKIARRSGKSAGRRAMEWPPETDAALISKLRALVSAGFSNPTKELGESKSLTVRCLRAVTEDGTPVYKSGKPRARDAWFDANPGEDSIRARLKELGVNTKGEKIGGADASA